MGALSSAAMFPKDISARRDGDEWVLTSNVTPNRFHREQDGK
jgi:hypothetical protein